MKKSPCGEHLRGVLTMPCRAVLGPLRSDGLRHKSRARGGAGSRGHGAIVWIAVREATGGGTGESKRKRRRCWRASSAGGCNAQGSHLTRSSAVSDRCGLPRAVRGAVPARQVPLRGTGDGLKKSPCGKHLGGARAPRQRRDGDRGARGHGGRDGGEGVVGWGEGNGRGWESRVRGAAMPKGRP